MFQLEKVYYSVSNGQSGPLNLLSNISLEIKQGLIYTILGPSGAGKSTLLGFFNRLLDPTRGQILLDGKNIKDYPVQVLRRRVGMLLQKPHMFPGTVEDNLNYGPRLIGESVTHPSKLLESVGLEDNLLHMSAEKLSGGQQQRVAFARVLANKPEVLLLDEATSALDIHSAQMVDELILKLVKNQGLTVIMVTHNLHQAQAVGDYGIFLDKGFLVERGPIGEMGRLS